MALPKGIVASHTNTSLLSTHTDGFDRSCLHDLSVIATYPIPDTRTQRHGLPAFEADAMAQAITRDGIQKSFHSSGETLRSRYPG